MSLQRDALSKPQLSDQLDVKSPMGLEQNRRRRAWGATREPFYNIDARSSIIDVILLLITVAFNKGAPGRHFYLWLNANYSPFQINCFWTFGITTIIYWAYGLIFMAIDLTRKPAFIYRYKLQPYRSPTRAEYWQICKVVLRNQFAVALPLSAITAGPLTQLTGMGDTSYEGLPGFWKTLLTFVFCMLCEECGFFYVHRWLHEPARYAKYHKMHHTFTAPCALAATYCTMTEHVLSNLLPIMLGLALLGSHWSMVIYFFCALEIGTLNTHSGFNIPGLHNSTKHDWHHFSFNENFGPVGILDQIYGSNKKFKQALAEAVALKGSSKAGEHHLAGRMAQAAFDEPE